MFGLFSSQDKNDKAIAKGLLDERLKERNRILSNRVEEMKAQLAFESVMKSTHFLSDLRDSIKCDRVELRVGLDQNYKVSVSVVATNGRLGSPTGVEQLLNEFSVLKDSGESQENLSNRVLKEMKRSFERNFNSK